MYDQPQGISIEPSQTLHSWSTTKEMLTNVDFYCPSCNYPFETTWHRLGTNKLGIGLGLTTCFDIFNSHMHYELPCMRFARNALCVRC